MLTSTLHICNVYAPKTQFFECLWGFLILVCSTEGLETHCTPPGHGPAPYFTPIQSSECKEKVDILELLHKAKIDLKPLLSTLSVNKARLRESSECHKCITRWEIIWLFQWNEYLTELLYLNTRKGLLCSIWAFQYSICLNVFLNIFISFYLTVLNSPT